jgi:hypothetical protein
LAAWSQRVPVGRSRTVPQASRYAGVRICLDTPSTLTAAHIHQCLRSSFRVTPSVLTRFDWCRNVDLLSIGYDFRPGLRIRLTLRGLPLLRKPWVFGVRGSHPDCRYLCRQNLFREVQPSSRSTFDPHGMLLYHSRLAPQIRMPSSFSIILSRTLGYSPCLPVSDCDTDETKTPLEAFLGSPSKQ